MSTNLVASDQGFDTIQSTVRNIICSAIQYREVVMRLCHGRFYVKYWCGAERRAGRQSSSSYSRDASGVSSHAAFCSGGWGRRVFTDGDRGVCRWLERQAYLSSASSRLALGAWRNACDDSEPETTTISRVFHGWLFRIIRGNIGLRGLLDGTIIQAAHLSLLVANNKPTTRC